MNTGNRRIKGINNRTAARHGGGSRYRELKSRRTRPPEEEI